LFDAPFGLGPIESTITPFRALCIVVSANLAARVFTINGDVSDELFVAAFCELLEPKNSMTHG
jgi:hypothetical protein